MGVADLVTHTAEGIRGVARADIQRGADERQRRPRYISDSAELRPYDGLVSEAAEYLNMGEGLVWVRALAHGSLLVVTTQRLFALHEGGGDESVELPITHVVVRAGPNTRLGEVICNERLAEGAVDMGSSRSLDSAKTAGALRKHARLLTGTSRTERDFVIRIIERIVKLANIE